MPIQTLVLHREMETFRLNLEIFWPARKFLYSREPLEKSQKINKRRAMFNPDSRVNSTCFSKILETSNQ